jgi:glucokinase
MIVLAGDIGGTHVRLALFRGDDSPLRPFARTTVYGAEHEGLGAPVRDFLVGAGVQADVACLGIAGRIDGRRVHGVNMPWAIDADELEQVASIPRVELINDFHAAARGVDSLDLGEDVFAIGGGSQDPGRPVAVVGAGTGLGQAFLVPSPGGHQVVPTEGGHRAFAPRDAQQDALLGFLRQRHGHVSTERVLSGPGLVAIYDFLLAEGRPEAAAVASADDAARAISELALADAHPTCREALTVFVRVYGGEAADVALSVLAGAVFLAGGIAPQVLAAPPFRGLFRRAFEDKGRFSAWLSGVPVYVITNGELGLLGAAGEALRAV